MKSTFKIILNFYRLLFLYISFVYAKKQKEIIEDIEHWNEVKKCKKSNLLMLTYYMIDYLEFRSLYHYRIRVDSMFYWIIKFLFPGEKTLRIETSKIGGGLFIQHGFATIIAAKEIGKHCWINQQVTVGYKGDQAPIIGDNVKIYCGAIVIGNVIVGDGSVIGAGSVVTKDIAEGAVMVGNPAREIK